MATEARDAISFGLPNGDVAQQVEEVFNRRGFVTRRISRRERSAIDLLMFRQRRVILVSCIEDAARANARDVRAFAGVVSLMPNVEGMMVSARGFSLAARIAGRLRRIKLLTTRQLVALE